MLEKLWNKKSYDKRHYQLRRHLPKLKTKKNSGRTKPQSNAPSFNSLKQVHASETTVYSCRK
jgi:hypothetical protein